MNSPEIDSLIMLLAKLPGLGPRSARRAVLHLIKRREGLMVPLSQALADTAGKIKTCGTCGNLDTSDPCLICRDPERDKTSICVIEDAGDLWALERSGIFSGQYHVLGGVLSALDGIGPDDLTIDKLVARVRHDGISEVILALNATVDGQTTAHVIMDRLEGTDAKVSGLAHGLPVGGELDYLDDGTIAAAFRARRSV